MMISIFSKNRVAAWFIIFVVISSIVAWCVMSHANNSLRESHDIILNHHEKSFEIADSLISFTNSLLKDSTVKTVDKVIISQRIENATNSFSNQENEQKIKNLLELEFSKIQNEYEVLNLWCALLTVVFLIFSFFSIFKTNELSNQGEEALLRLRQVAHEAKSKSDDIDSKISEAEDKINTKEEELSKTLENKIEALHKKLDAFKSNFKEFNSNIEECNKKADFVEERINNSDKITKDIIKSALLEVNDKISEVIEREVRYMIENKANEIEYTSNEVKNLKKLIEKIQESVVINDSVEEEEEENDYDLESEADEAEHDN